MSPAVEPATDVHDPTPVAAVEANPRNVALWVIAALAIIAALKLAEVVLVPVVLAILISYALDPLVTLLQRGRVPRGLAATLVLGALCTGMVAAGYALRDDATALVEQLPDVAHRLGQVLQARGAKNNPVNKVQQAAGEIEKAATAATKPAAAAAGVPRVEVQEPTIRIRDYLLAGSMGAAGVAAQIVVVIVLALYLLAADDMFKRKLVKMVGPSLTSKKITLQILQDIDRQIALFLLVRLAISAVVGVATWLALELVGLHHAVFWGIGAGLLNTVPYLGPAVIAAAVAVAGFLQFGTVVMAAAAAGATVVVTTFEGYWLTPWLTSRAAQMNAVAVFIGLLFWGWLWGIWGMLLAVPLLMVMKAVCDRIEELQPFGELLGD